LICKVSLAYRRFRTKRGGPPNTIHVELVHLRRKQAFACVLANLYGRIA